MNRDVGLTHIALTSKNIDASVQFYGEYANSLVREPVDSGYPAGYWAFIKDPGRHNLELSYGQEVGLAVANA